MSVVLFGAQWGDEGKGKVVSNLSRLFNIAVRFQGGSNAGHTVIKGGVINKFSMIPCAILEKDVKCILGSGVVLDMEILAHEIRQIDGLGIDTSNLLISDNASVILPVHRAIDSMLEGRRKKKIGTTGKGIGLCYEDRVGRRALRLCDIMDLKLDNIIEELEYRYCSFFTVDGGFEEIRSATISEITKYKSILDKFIVSSNTIFDMCSDPSNQVLFEGSQGFWLDVYHGTYPYVTSSSTMPIQACAGTPTTPTSLGMLIGVVKSYVTRVGNGPMPTEQSNDFGEMMVVRGGEYGTVTNRKRRCGWFDAVMVRQALKMSGAHALILTKLDVLDSFDMLKICVGYRSKNGSIINYFPSSIRKQEDLEPVYEELPGWNSSTYGLKYADSMPQNALLYIRRIEELVGLPIVMLSTTPMSEDMVVLDSDCSNRMVGQNHSG